MLPKSSVEDDSLLHSKMNELNIAIISVDYWSTELVDFELSEGLPIAFSIGRSD